MIPKYPKLKDYEGFIVDAEKEILRLACCDCGAVHDVKLVSEKDGKTGIIFRRSRRATAQLRRYRYGNLQNESIKSGYKMIRISG